MKKNAHIEEIKDWDIERDVLHAQLGGAGCFHIIHFQFSLLFSQSPSSNSKRHQADCCDWAIPGFAVSGENNLHPPLGVIWTFVFIKSLCVSRLCGVSRELSFHICRQGGGGRLHSHLTFSFFFLFLLQSRLQPRPCPSIKQSMI